MTERKRFGEWVRAARAGDDAALGKLVRATQDRLFRFLVLQGCDRALAADVLQESYLYAFEHLGDLAKPEAFLSWVFRIAKHKFLDHRRSPRNASHLQPEALDTMGLSTPDRELAQGVRETLAQLPEEARTVLLLVDVEGYSYAEAAEILEVSEAAATSRLRRARAAFQEKYRGDTDDRNHATGSPTHQRGQAWVTKKTTG